ncbi:MAG: hypothetical protein ACYDBJ_06140 [Aggregatilineales bacterium]
MTKRPRSPNGQAKSPAYLLTFDPTNEAEQRAWAVMQRLAAQRRAKPVLIGFLMALSEIEMRTNQHYSVEDMMALFVTSVVSGQRGGFAPAGFALGDLSDETPSIIVGTADHADPDEVRDELALGMGDLFGDD